MDTDKNKDEDDGFITIILEFESATNNAASLQEGEKQQQQRSASPQTKIPGESSTSTHQLSTGLGQAPYEPTEEQILESTEKTSKPLRALAPRRTQGVKRRRRRGKDTTDDDEDNAETSTSTTALRDQDEKRLKGWSDIGSGISSNIQMGELLGQVNEQLSSQTSLTTLFKTVVGIMLDITSYTRAAVYEFDNSDWSGKVVAELVDIKVTHDLFQGLHFPPGDIPKQARDLYLVNKVRILFDRDSSTSKMLSKPDTIKDKASQVDMTYSFLRAMSPYHIQFIEKIGVRSSMSLSITVDDQLWGMILLHHYGDVGKRVSFPMRMLCLQIGESITRNIERLKRWKQMHLHDFVTSILASSSPREFILEKPDQLVDLFQASYGVLVLDDEERLLGLPELLQESSDASHYIQTQHFVNVVSSNDVYSDLPGLSVGIEPSLTQRGLIIPLSTNGNNFLALFRKAIVNRKTWAGIPTQEDKDKMQIRKSFSAWSDVTISESAEWQQDKRDAASMLKLKLCTD
jgi:light-regulated signal transduction histidine kinase (bacteriophytochrome)